MSRRSRVASKTGRIDLGKLSNLLYAAYGVTGETRNVKMKARTAPSGGALFPLDLYWISQSVDGLANGIYHYNPILHCLETLTNADVTSQIASAFIQEEMRTGKIGYVVITGVFWRTRIKYGLRGCRFVFLEAGHVAQNLNLAAEASGVMAVCLGGYHDNKVNELVGADGRNETTVYVVALS